MSCPGLHCPGCSGGQSLAIGAAAVVGLVLAAETVTWVAERIWWIGGTIALCAVLSVAASMALEARSARRAAEWGAARGILSRADVILPYPARITAIPAEPDRPALPAPQVVFNIFGQLDAEQARIIRQALNQGDQ